MRTLKELISLLPKNGIPVTEEESIYLLENLNKTTSKVSDDFRYRMGNNFREVEYLYKGRIFNLLFTIDKKTNKNVSIVFTSYEFWELCTDIKIS